MAEIGIRFFDNTIKSIGKIGVIALEVAVTTITDNQEIAEIELFYVESFKKGIRAKIGTITIRDIPAAKAGEPSILLKFTYTQDLNLNVKIQIDEKQEWSMEIPRVVWQQKSIMNTIPGTPGANQIPGGVQAVFAAGSGSIKKHRVMQQLPKQQQPEQQSAKQQSAKQQPPEQQSAKQQSAKQHPPEQQFAKQHPPEQQFAKQQSAKQQPPEQQSAKQHPPEQQPASDRKWFFIIIAAAIAVITALIFLLIYGLNSAQDAATSGKITPIRVLSTEPLPTPVRTHTAEAAAGTLSAVQEPAATITAAPTEVQKTAAASPEQDNMTLLESRLQTLFPLYFYPDSLEMLPGYYSRIDEIAGVLAGYHGKIVVTLTGHAAESGSTAGQMTISLNRAMLIRDELLKRNTLTPGQYRTQGKGITEPVYTGGDPAQQYLNRRVEIMVRAGN